MSRLVTRAIRADDWQLARSLRCAALADAPEAFAARLADELALTDAAWQARARSNERGHETIGFFALVEDEPVGLVVGIWNGGPPPFAELVSLWVAPRARRLGAAQALCEAICDWAASRACERVALRVTPSNTPAQRLYLRLGFHRTEGCSDAQGCITMARRLSE